MLSTAKKLYDTDFNLWVEETANLLKEGKWEYLDLENLIEEIEAMGRSDKKALKSNLEKLLLHLLKWKYQPSKRSHSWQYSITEQCLRLLEVFEDSPSLKVYFEEVFDQCYQNACLLAARETGLDKKTFRLFGLCYAMDGGYKGWNPYIERHLAIFVNCFCSRAN
jgi:hypothetical protein